MGFLVFVLCTCRQELGNDPISQVGNFRTERCRKKIQSYAKRGSGFKRSANFRKEWKNDAYLVYRDADSPVGK